MSWGYDKDNGPDTWYKHTPIAKGVRQSPVDLQPAKIKTDKSLGPLSVHYSEESDLQMENPGLAFKMNMSANSILSGGPLGHGKFKLVQFHFHWGHDECVGSEHTVNGKMYPSELHLVHYNSDKYGSFQEAVTHRDGLSVLGVFIKIGAEHEGFNTLSKNCPKVKAPHAKVNTGAKFNPACLLPSNLNDYWTYEGSLTTPPLCESVRWIVLRNEIEISKAQIDAMRSLCCDKTCSKQIPANFRPPQPLNDREIKASF